MSDDKIRVGTLKGMVAQAKDIDNNGVWHSPYGEMELLGKQMPITKNMQTGKETEEVLMIVPVEGYLDMCYECGEEFPEGTIMLVMESVRMIPAHCCNQILWKRDEVGEGYE